ncbi:hypothetical protein DICVIV_14511 [Dictyocaulus viviparus]|uniref:Uncharacterized protein n=1 Tax=Dictyocaulus viviparus TaxID=29172 RepID=A0A0D8XAR8_DICVI|nr:hypothetical protein DICVIV_14511 [Dictyocaulus viviparus]
MAKSETEKIQLERKPLPEKQDSVNDSSQLTETILTDIFGRKKRDTSSAKKDEDYYAYESDADYDVTGIGNTSCEFSFFFLRYFLKYDRNV